VETQTGNGFETLTRYYLTNGVEVTNEIRDATWSFWSLPQRFSGQEFLSPTPRRWLRAKVRLISDDPHVFPSLRRLTFTATDPVIASGVTGVVSPREARLDSLQGFVYTLTPGPFAPDDIGFDRVAIKLPRETAEVFLDYVRIGAQQVNASMELRDGFLVVRLPGSGRTRSSCPRSPPAWSRAAQHHLMGRRKSPDHQIGGAVPEVEGFIETDDGGPAVGPGRLLDHLVALVSRQRLDDQDPPLFPGDRLVQLVGSPLAFLAVPPDILQGVGP
jgi:hypothetical protein